MQPSVTPCLLLVRSSASSRAKNYAQHRAQKYVTTLSAFLLTETLQARTSLLPVDKLHLNTVGFFSCDPEEKKQPLAARAKFRAQYAACAV